MKHVCNDIYDFLSNKADSFLNQQWYETTLDLIDSKIPTSKTTKIKSRKLTLTKLYFVNKGMDIIKLYFVNKGMDIIKLHFVNKGMDIINISQIINDKNVKKLTYTI